MPTTTKSTTTRELTANNSACNNVSVGSKMFMTVHIIQQYNKHSNGLMKLCNVEREGLEKCWGQWAPGCLLLFEYI